MKFTASTTGSVESRFTGTINVLKGNFASIDADGFLRKEPAHVRWEASGSPSQVSHALTVAVIRLGITHNLALLAGGAKMIEHADGGIDQALRMTNVAWDAKAKKFTYHIVVEGNDAGTGELWVGRGDMHVDEKYEWR